MAFYSPALSLLLQLSLTQSIYITTHPFLWGIARQEWRQLVSMVKAFMDFNNKISMETSDYHGKNTGYCTNEKMTIEIITVTNLISNHIKFTGDIYSGPPVL